ncbi:MAG: hypothetical protein QOE77_1251 [Blastocatellia bacterium]|jgi:hypothetical protein|nr:hypothetical protein [Blastocatellia bacterium]
MSALTKYMSALIISQAATVVIWSAPAERSGGGGALDFVRIQD